MSVTLIVRLALTAIVVAQKMFDDQYANNSFYAEMGGIEDIEEFNIMEAEFL